MTARSFGALAALAVACGCSAIPEGGDVRADLADIAAQVGRPKLGRIAVAPVARIELSATELAKGWQAADVFDAGEIQRDVVRGLEATESYDSVRVASSDALGDSWRNRDDLVASLALENVRVTCDLNGWWIPNMVNFVLWIWPAWLVAKEDYTLAFEARIAVRSGDSGALLVEKVVTRSVTGSFDEFDRGLQVLGPIYPLNGPDHWRRVVSKLLPAARRTLAGAAARELEGALRDPTTLLEPKRRKTLVVAVGVTKYADTNALPPVPYAAADARDFAGALGARGLPPEHASVLLDAEATLDAVRGALGAHLDRARDGDEVVFYFAGYATRRKDGTPVLLLHDGGPERGRLGLDELGRILAEKRGRKLVVIDAAFDGRNRSVAGGRVLAGDDLASLGEAAALVAGGPGEPALAPDYLGHGLLTFHVLEAVRRHDGALSGEELLRSVRPLVVSEATYLGEPERPRGRGLERFSFEHLSGAGER